MSFVPITPSRIDWPSAIGSFLLSFGMLEHFVFVFLKDRLSEAEFDKVKERHLKDRLARIGQYLKEANCSATEQAAFVALATRVEPMRGASQLHQPRAHVLPRSRGGKDEWENLVWSSKWLAFAEFRAANSRGNNFNKGA
jgi:hypothetical protein